MSDETWDDAPCTDCGDTGITYQTERVCSCLAGLAIEMIDADACPSLTDRISSLEAQLLAAERERDALREALREAENERDEAVDWTGTVERHGVDKFDALAEKWTQMVAISRMINAIASPFDKYADDAILGRFKKTIRDMMMAAFVEGSLAGVRAEIARAAYANHSAPVVEE